MVFDLVTISDLVDLYGCKNGTKDINKQENRNNDKFPEIFSFIIIDNKYLYHSRASFKELGKKCFALNKIENEEWIKEVLEKIK